MKREISRLLTILVVLLLGLGVSIAKASAVEPDGDGNYPLWVGDTRVSETNKNNVLGDTGTPTVIYNPETNTLTLNNPTITGMKETYVTESLIKFQVFYLDSESDDLFTIEGTGTIGGIYCSDNLVLNGNFTVTNEELPIYCWNHVGISGGTIKISSDDKMGGILASNVTISDGTVTVEGEIYARGSYGDVIISGKNTAVSVTSEDYQAIGAQEKVLIINGAKVTAEGRECGIRGWSNGEVLIHGAETVVEAKATSTEAEDVFAITAGSVGIFGGTVTAQATSSTGGVGICGFDSLLIGTRTDVEYPTVTFTSLEDLGVQIPSIYLDTSAVKKITATGGQMAVFSENDIIIEEGYVITKPSTGETAALDSDTHTVVEDLSAETPEAAHEVVIEKVEFYPLWIEGLQVTSVNKDKIPVGEGFAQYDPNTNTLTLDGLTREATSDDDQWYLVYEEEKVPLTVEVKGTNTISYGAGGFTADSAGIVFTGTGTLTLSGHADAVVTYEDVVIEENCTVNAVTDDGAGFNTRGSFECAGTAKVTGSDSEAVGVLAQGNITITGTFTTKGLTDDGLCADGKESSIVIDGGKVNVEGICSKGTIDIINSSKVISEVKKTEETEAPGIYANSDITIKDSTVTATSKAEAGIYCISPGDTAKITIDNSTVVAKSIPWEEEATGGLYIYPNVGIYLAQGEISITNSDVTAEGSGGIYAETGNITITGGKVNATTKMEVEGVHAGIQADSDGTITITDATVTLESALIGLMADDGTIEISGGELECKAGYTGIEAKILSFGESAKGAPVVGITMSDGGTGIMSNNALIDAGEITITGGSGGIFSYMEAEGDGLVITNGITKVTIESSEIAAYINLADADAKGIQLGDELVIKEPEGGMISDDATTFEDKGKTIAKKVVIVKECSITFDANGGTGTMAGTSAESGSEYELPACGFTAPKGQAFDGWLVGDASEVVDAGTKITVTGSVVIKPQWAKIVYKITKGADGTWKDGDGAYEIVVVTEPDPSVCWPNFLSVACDGTTWTKGTEYDASEGSTKILIKEDTLKAMSEGKHDIVIAFTDAEVATSLTISKQAADDGGDDDNNGGTNDDNNGGNNGGTDDDNNGGTNGDNNGGTDGDNNGGNNGGTDGGNGNVESPKTGDSMPYAVLLLIAAMAGAGIGASVIFRRRSERA